jgi:hypothetical protein
VARAADRSPRAGERLKSGALATGARFEALPTPAGASATCKIIENLVGEADIVCGTASRRELEKHAAPPSLIGGSAHRDAEGCAGLWRGA